MFIKEITIKSFRHLENIHLGPFHQPSNLSDLVVLAGPNGGGKSSILELLAYSLSNTWSLSWALRRSFPTNSFEVAISVTPFERNLIKEFIESSQSRYSDDVLEHLEENGTYFRAYNYQEGKYQEKSSIYNQVHNLVTQALRNYYHRSLGFFLRSDRYYPPEAFRRERLFEYDEMIKPDYIYSIAFNTSDIQYKDMFEFLIQQRYHYFRHLGVYQHKVETLGASNLDHPVDPLKEYDQLLQKLFPGYEFAEGEGDVPTNLFIKIPSGDVIPFSDLSSGEKEVFFILSFFLRHDVSNSIIVIDEPELHLHPELARRLIRTMQSIKSGNQIWLATHNAEIIDEAGRDRVYYFVRNIETQKAELTLGIDESDALRILKDLFGYSGYIGVARSIVFLEGIDSSSDRKMFSALFPEYGSKIKFIPSKSVENLAKINTAILSILESDLGWMDFYLIRDRDYLTPDLVKKYSEHFSGRMKVLNRYHIENYLLDEKIIKKVQHEIFGQATTPEKVLERLRVIARNISGEVLRDMIAFRLNSVYRSEDFSLGQIMYKQPIIDQDGNWIEEKIAKIEQLTLKRIEEVNSELNVRTNKNIIESLIAKCKEEVNNAINGENDKWKGLFPGRRLLDEYAAQEGLGKSPVFLNSLIKYMSMSKERIPTELSEIIQTIADGKTFN
jgi:AAA15 family ATPase/GTPase/F0F1-type ATP synthase delta subunit